ncbi:unnamed protein product [Lupinus luteus]|uniref:Uncharacterized protein n=1 Tax=Lupinus luteus TaxID=3873 RepID=A0AAV1W836_LUPLU
MDLVGEGHVGVGHRVSPSPSRDDVGNSPPLEREHVTAVSLVWRLSFSGEPCGPQSSSTIVFRIAEMDDEIEDLVEVKPPSLEFA